MSDSQEQPLTLQTRWKFEDLPAPTLANQFLVVGGSNTSLGTQSREIQLVFGQINAPIIMQDPATGERKIENLENGQATISPVSQLSMTWDRMVEFSHILDTYIRENTSTYEPPASS